LKHNIIVLVGSYSERCLSVLSGKRRQTPEQCSQTFHQHGQSNKFAVITLVKAHLNLPTYLLELEGPHKFSFLTRQQRN
jgi:hypothetical protein